MRRSDLEGASQAKKNASIAISKEIRKIFRFKA